ncbi:MAG: ribonuclease HI family protein [Anaerolineales bacterium]
MAGSKGLLSCTLIFDGGSVGNPGDCYGSFRWKIADGPLSRPNRRRFGYGTNNQAEYMALIEGLESLLAELSSIEANPDEVGLEIRGDSRLVLKQLAGEWKVKNAALRKLHASAQSLIIQFGEVQLVHQARSETVRALGH